MKNRVWIVAGLLASVALAQDGVTMRRVLTESAEATYDMNVNSDSTFESPMGAQEIKSKVSSTLVMKIGKVAGESADVTLTNKDMKFEMDMGGMGAPPEAGNEMPKEMVTTGKIDHRNRLTDMKLDTKQAGGMGAMMARMSQSSANWSVIFFEFPEKAVKAGESWEVKVPANAEMGVGEAVYTMKFDGETDGLLRFSFTGKIPMNVDSSKMPGSDSMPFAFTMTGTTDSTGTAAYQKATGELLNYAATSKTTAQMDVMGQAIPVKVNTDLKLAKK